MTSKVKRCVVTNVCGYSLKQGVVMVGITSILISIATLLASVGTILSMFRNELVYNSNSVNAINMIFALFCSSTSLYQAMISIMLLWFGCWNKGSPFVLTLWFVSYVSLLVMYGCMFVASFIICFNARHYTQALFTFVGGCIYHAVFIYYSIIVGSYDSTIGPNTRYY